MAKKKKSTKKRAPSKKAKKSAGAKPKIKKKKQSRATRPKQLAVFDAEAVEGALDIMPGQGDLQQIADMLGGLANPSRLKAIVALSVAELCVGDVAAVVGLSLSATSTLLRHLRALGFVAARSAGKQTYYRLASDTPGAVLEIAFSALSEGD